MRKSVKRFQSLSMGNLGILLVVSGPENDSIWTIIQADDQEPIGDQPANGALGPICSSMRRSWLYLASRSLRAMEPILIWPTPVATARSAIVQSSVSPLRAEITQEKPAWWAWSITASVS